MRLRVGRISTPGRSVNSLPSSQPHGLDISLSLCQDTFDNLFGQFEIMEILILIEILFTSGIKEVGYRSGQNSPTNSTYFFQNQR